jgi:hypothetical protein
MENIRNEYGDTFWEKLLEHIKTTHETLRENEYEEKTEVISPPPRFGWSPTENSLVNAFDPEMDDRDFACDPDNNP